MEVGEEGVAGHCTGEGQSLYVLGGKEGDFDRKPRSGNTVLPADQRWYQRRHGTQALS